MAAVVFGSGSRTSSNRTHRAHHSTNSNSQHHRHHQAQQQQTSTAVISPISNYYGSATSPSQSSSAASTHHHAVGGVGGGTSSSSGTGHRNHNSLIIMPPASYLSNMQTTSTSQHQSLPPQYVSHHGVPPPIAHSPQQQQQQQPPIHYAQHQSLMFSAGRHQQQSKRKSAVELLAESKPFYVKSETLLDRHRQLNFRTISGSSVAQRSSGIMIVSANATNDRISNNACGQNGGGGETRSVNQSGNTCGVLSPSRTSNTGGAGTIVGTHHHHHHHHHRPANRRSASSSSDLLQTKLRKLLNTDSGKETQFSGPQHTMERSKKEPHKYDTFSRYQSVKYNQELSVHASNDQSDLSVMFPSAFLSPQSLPPCPGSDDDIYSYKVGVRIAGGDSGSTTDPLILTEDYRAISPPAEYAAIDNSPDKEQRCNYQRSYSHSHDTTSDEHDYSSPSYNININSHKSLPDLHSQISRHSPHSEVLSCCSRGNRSNKSVGGSSLNRDSGGSSGHYTHRSEPCCKQQQQQQQQHQQQQQQQQIQRDRETTSSKMCLGIGNDYRRDSGSSTQHSGNSYYTYGMSMSSSRYADCAECRSKYQKDSECLLNFTTPEVPEAFQDDYPSAAAPTPPPPPLAISTADTRPVTGYYEESRYISQRKIYTTTSHHQSSVQIQLREQPTHHQHHKHHSTATIQHLHHYYQQQQQQQMTHLTATTVRTPDDGSGIVVAAGGGEGGNFGGGGPKEPDLSPPPTAFKRQKCLRFKHRNRYSTSNDRCSNRGGDHERDYSDEDRRPILRSKSDISDRYYNRGIPMTEQPTGIGSGNGNAGKTANGMEKLRRSESMSQLEKFFDRLGLNEEKFDEIYSLPKRRYNSENESDDSSTVFFSDVSTVDSTRLPDSTETQPQTSQTYRPTEPPSIVERNARIIKWLCNCRKLQLT